MEIEFLKLLINGGVSSVLLGFVLWRFVPALSLLQTEVRALITTITLHAAKEEKFMERLDARMIEILDNHLEHLPMLIADEVEKRLKK